MNPSCVWKRVKSCSCIFGINVGQGQQWDWCCGCGLHITLFDYNLRADGFVMVCMSDMHTQCRMPESELKIGQGMKAALK